MVHPKFIRIILIVLITTTTISTALHAEIPTAITYQGRLTDSLGNPVADVEHDVVFNIYEDDTSPTVLWSSGTLSGTPTNGFFSAHLKPIPADVFTSGSQRYLGITVDGNPEMTPRVEITCAPYAYQALVADTARYAYAAPASPDDDWTIDGNTIYHSPGNVGIGVSSPNEPLVVGSDLGSSYEGNYIVSGAPVWDFTCGYKLGWNNSYHATLEWYGDGPPLAIHTRENGTAYNNTLVVKSGNIGINNTLPSERLSVGTNLGNFFGDFVTVGNPDSPAGYMFGQSGTNYGYVYRGTSGTVEMHNVINGVFCPGITLDSNRVGILNYTPEAALTIGDDVGNYYGTWLTIGDATTSETGIIFGENEDNNCHIYRNGVGTVYINSYEDGVRYSGLRLKKTNLGIGLGALETGPSENLVVGKDLGSYTGDLIVVGNDMVGQYSGVKIGEDSDNNGNMLWSNDDNYLYFTTKAGGVSYTPLVLKGWDVGMGTSNPSERLHVVGNICYTGSIGACSDLRYKRDIHTIENALDRVSRLRGVSFEWKQDEYPDQKFSDKEQIGLVAQEVKDVVPQVVSETNEGYYNIDYSKLTALLVEAVKELKAENEELRSRIDKLEEH